MTSLEISKQIYERLGWLDSDEKTDYEVLEYVEGNLYPQPQSDRNMLTVFICPAYDSEYLLAKLQVGADWKYGRFDLSHCYDDENGYHWEATYNNIEDGFPIGISDTPADALGLLVLKLADKGILKREEAE